MSPDERPSAGGPSESPAKATAHSLSTGTDGGRVTVAGEPGQAKGMLRPILLRQHQVLLERSAISIDFARGLGVRSVLSDVDLPEPLQIHAGHGAAPGLLFPWRGPDGTVDYQLRPDQPVADVDGKVRKYLQGKGVHLLNVLGDLAGQEVWMVEGTKQTLAAAAHVPPGVLVAGAVADGAVFPDERDPADPIQRREPLRAARDGRDGAAIRPGRDRSALGRPVEVHESSRLVCGAARTHLEAGLSQAEALELSYLQLSCKAQLVGLDVRAGKLSRAQANADAVMTAAREQGWSSPHGVTAALVGLAEIAVLRDEPASALRHLSAAERVVRPVDRLNQVRISFLGATALCASGQVAAASEEFERVEALAGSGEGAAGLPGWVPALVRTERARLAMCRGRPDLGLAALDGGLSSEPVATVVGPEEVLRAELLLRCSRPLEATQAVTPWTSDCVAPVRVGALVIEALAGGALGQHEAAIASIDGALEAAAGERIIQPFVSPGPGARPLLQAVLDRGSKHEEFAMEVLQHLLGGACPGRTSTRSPLFMEPLSDRELQVLRLMQGTLSNAEIADRLFISVNTLRSHVKSINRKLAVEERREAVRRARELSLI